jgi:hypothetical protein
VALGIGNANLPTVTVRIDLDTPPGGDYKDQVTGDRPAYYFGLNDAGATTTAQGSTLDDLTVTPSGTYFGSPTLQATGALPAWTFINHGVQFDGIDDYIEIAAAVLHENMPKWTLEAWVNPSAALVGASDDAPIIAHEWTSPQTIPMILGYGSATGFFAAKQNAWCGFWTGSAWQFIGDSTVLPLNTWTHLAATFDGSILRLYRNGVLATFSGPTAGWAAANAVQKLRIGRRWDASGTKQFFPGVLDEVAIFPRALSAERIYAHYNARTAPLPAVWTDVTQYVRKVSLRQASRQSKASRFEAGQLVVDFSNDGRFDPSNAAGPYYPKLGRGRRISVLATAQPFERFAGVITDVQQLSRLGRDYTARVTATDVLGQLAEARIPTGFTRPAELAGARGREVARAVGLVAVGGGSFHVFNTGTKTLAAQAALTADGNALGYLQDVAQAEGGNLRTAYDASPGGRLWLEDAAYRPAHTTPAATFGLAGGSEIPYTGLELMYGEDEWTIVEVTPASGTVQRSVDLAGNAARGERTLSLNAPMLQNDADALTLAAALRSQSTPSVRVKSLTVEGAINWNAVLSLGVSSPVTVKWTNAAGALVTTLYYIDGIEDEIVLGSYRTKLLLSLF